MLLESLHFPASSQFVRVLEFSEEIVLYRVEDTKRKRFCPHQPNRALSLCMQDGKQREYPQANFAQDRILTIHPTLTSLIRQNVVPRGSIHHLCHQRKIRAIIPKTLGCLQVLQRTARRFKQARFQRSRAGDYELGAFCERGRTQSSTVRHGEYIGEFIETCL